MVSFFGFVILVSFLISKVEINIEGKHGYAEKLPVVWRTKNKWVKLFLAGTSYHLYMGLFLLAILHTGFAIGLVEWTLGGELLILSFLAFVTVLEDFSWFLFNPSRDKKTGKRLYGLRNFNGEHIPWFTWFLGLPIWYWWYAPAAVLLYVGSQMLE